MFYYKDERFNSWDFLNKSDDALVKFMRKTGFNVNKNWSPDNPVLHFLLANEKFSDFARILALIPNHIDPNLCDGKEFGKKSLLIFLAMLPMTNELTINFIKTYKHNLKFDYQDAHGKTALHYAIILGRADIVDLLISLGASTAIKDKDGKTPTDYIGCSEQMIYDTLQRVDIEPYRDVYALENRLHDHYGRNLILQGAKVTQNKDVIERVYEAQLTLYKYIQGSSRGWASFIGDDHLATYKEMYTFAKGISHSKDVRFEDVFVHEKLSEQEHQAFRANLKNLQSEFFGETILDRCIKGHDKIKNLSHSKYSFLYNR